MAFQKFGTPEKGAEVSEDFPKEAPDEVSDNEDEEEEESDKDAAREK